MHEHTLNSGLSFLYMRYQEVEEFGRNGGWVDRHFYSKLPFPPLTCALHIAESNFTESVILTD